MTPPCDRKRRARVHWTSGTPRGSIPPRHAVLAFAKLRVNARLGSGVLRAEAKETLACSWLSLTLLLGLGASAWRAWWWADPIAALVMVYFVVREAREALTGAHEGDE